MLAMGRPMGTVAPATWAAEMVCWTEKIVHSRGE
jgi:hypothetical protein